ncbi:MAG: M14 family zinc carboxypeptidase, partial [Vicinamibacterales bacterium]
MRLTVVLSCAAVAVLSLAPVAQLGAQAQGAKALAGLKTRAESSEFRETSHYDDVVAFLDAVAKAAPKTVRLTTHGKTSEGRALPLAVIGAPEATADAVKKTGKLRVFIQANIHAG